MWRIEEGADGHVLREATGKRRVIKVGGWLRPRRKSRMGAWLLAKGNAPVEEWIGEFCSEFGPVQRPLFFESQTSILKE